jgi:hypothetical protein
VDPNLTLNLLRKSRMNPCMYAYAQFNGQYDFNRVPMVPPGTRVIVHENPDQWASWDHHGVDGYYLGPALHHYRCYQVYITKTRGTRVVCAVELFPSKTAMPQTSSKALASIAALELSHALPNPAPDAPFHEIRTAQLQALCQLSEIFTAALPPTATPHSPPDHNSGIQFLQPLCHGSVPLVWQLSNKHLHLMIFIERN